MFQCYACSAIYQRPKQLQRHIQVAHKEIHWKCQDCDRDFFNAEELRRHQNRIHSGKGFDCVTCEQAMKINEIQAN